MVLSIIPAYTYTNYVLIMLTKFMIIYNYKHIYIIIESKNVLVQKKIRLKGPHLNLSLLF